MVGSWLLGLDIGSDSIGWATFACPPEGQPKATKLLAGGARLFDSGRDPKEQTSYTRERGIKRRARRQPRGRRWRREQLQRLLAEGLVASHPPILADRAWHLRAKATHEPVSPEELRVVLLHMHRHRGFRSNLLAAPTADRMPAPNVPEGDADQGFWREAERDIRRRMQQVGAGTVSGLMVAELEAGRPVRMRYNRSDVKAATRSLVAEELEAIENVQAPIHGRLEWRAVEELILDQRPLRSAEAGRCEFFPDEERALRALPSLQEYRIRQALANLRVPEGFGRDPRPLSPEEFDTALEALSQNEYETWTQLRGRIGLRGRKFTIEEAPVAGKRASRGIEGNLIEAIMGPLVPNWERRTAQDRDALVADLWAARHRRRNLLIAIARHLPALADEAAETLADVVQFELPTGRASISLKAARLINGALVAGVRWHEAVLRATGIDHSDRRPTRILDRLPYYAEILPGTGMNASGDPAEPNPEIRYGRLMNISVHIALNETRKVVNALLDRYGTPPRLIVVETTRELKAGAEERRRIIKEQSGRERENREIDAELKASGAWLANARERRLRYRLWRRQNNVCPYTGAVISGADLLTAAYEIDHVIPRSKGGRDTEANMVLCEAAANREKDKRTPYEAFGDAWVPARDSFLAGLDKVSRKHLEWRLSKEAAQRVARGDGDEDDQGWAPRQIVDTSYTARIVRSYLAHIVPPEPLNGVVAMSGRLTGWLRSAWHLPKSRADHRSHFIDAAVIATTDRSVVHRANTLHGRPGGDTLPDPQEADFPEPFFGFADQVVRRFGQIWPSHRPRHREAEGGELHKETVYGVRAVPEVPEKRRLVIRKPIHSLFVDHNGKPLADDTVRKVIESFASRRMRDRFLAVVEEARRQHPEASLTQLCLEAAAAPLWGPRGMTGNTVLDGPAYEAGAAGVVWNFRGNPKGAVRTGNNAVYEVWEMSGRDGKSRWRHRVLTRYGASRGEEDQPLGSGRKIFSLRAGDFLYWPGAEPDKLWRVKQMKVDGRLHVWPARYATGKKAAPKVQEVFDSYNLNGEEGYKFSSAEGMRKAGIRTASVSILGRLRVAELPV